jgi:hypothetical protein
LATFGAALAAGFREALDANGRDGFAERAGRRPCDRFLSGLRLEEIRAFTARRNFAMPGW